MSATSETLSDRLGARDARRGYYGIKLLERMSVEEFDAFRAGEITARELRRKHIGGDSA